VAMLLEPEVQNRHRDAQGFTVASVGEVRPESTEVVEASPRASRQLPPTLVSQGGARPGWRSGGEGLVAVHELDPPAGSGAAVYLIPLPDGAVEQLLSAAPTAGGGTTRLDRTGQPHALTRPSRTRTSRPPPRRRWAAPRGLSTIRNPAVGLNAATTDPPPSRP